MTNLAARPQDHAALMDSVYRGQRHIYDVTRKYYLFGRDTLINRLKCRPGDAVLEVGCGTGRNLRRIGRRWNGVALHGLDISREMLASAGARLGEQARLVHGDATSWEPRSAFGRDGFDRIVLSYALSMIPDWQAALRRAADALAPGGSLHIVDFGDLAGLPGPMRRGLLAWLDSFHATPRDALPQIAAALALPRNLALRVQRGPLGYYRIVTLTRRD